MTAKLRVNPRKLWYDNVESIDATEPQSVDLPAQAASTVAPPMLASGYSPIYPAHVSLSELRTKCVGTGPFKLKEYRQGELIELREKF